MMRGRKSGGVGVAFAGGPCSRNPGVALNEEAEGLFRPLSGIVHADSRRSGEGGEGGKERAVHQGEGRSAQIVAGEAPVDGEGPAEAPRTGDGTGKKSQGLQRPDEDGAGKAFRLRDDVQAVVHAVDHVDIGPAAGAEHHRGSCGLSPGGVAGEVVGSEVGLDLHDAAGKCPAVVLSQKNLPQKVPGHFLRRAFIKGLRKRGEPEKIERALHGEWRLFGEGPAEGLDLRTVHSLLPGKTQMIDDLSLEPLLGMGPLALKAGDPVDGIDG